MKNVILSIAVIASMAFVSCKSEAKKETKKVPTEVVKEIAKTDISFGVRGNCGMCKRTIEKAANSVGGVMNAIWDVDQKKIAVSFDESKIDAMAIHTAIAASGYDTEKVAGNEAAYKDLPGCCKYDHEMVMNVATEMK
jgi:mercuric ion binding protein